MGQSKSVSMYARLAWWAQGKVHGTAHRAGKTGFSLQALPNGLHAITMELLHALPNCQEAEESEWTSSAMSGRLRQPSFHSVSKSKNIGRDRNRVKCHSSDISLAVEAHSTHSVTENEYLRRTLSIRAPFCSFKRPHHSGRASWSNGGFPCGMSTCAQAPCMAVRGTYILRSSPF